MNNDGKAKPQTRNSKISAFEQQAPIHEVNYQAREAHTAKSHRGPLQKHGQADVASAIVSDSTAHT